MRYLLLYLSVAFAASAATPAEVSAALSKAVTFYHGHAAAHGGYVYRYSADFSLREAEGIPGPDTIWIQPPGTPAVGMAFLDAYEATKDKACLTAAVEAAQAVSRTQLTSGGWDYSGHFDAMNRAKHLYRRDVEGRLIDRKKFPQSEAGWHGKRFSLTYSDKKRRRITAGYGTVSWMPSKPLAGRSYARSRWCFHAPKRSAGLDFRRSRTSPPFWPS